MSKDIEYFFSPTSPWTYLGHDRFVDIASRHDARILLKPMDLPGQVFPVSGGLPLPKRPPQRVAYRAIELERFSEYLGLPLNVAPRHFPVSGDIAARAIIAADRLVGTPVALELTGRILRAVWADEKNIADITVLAALATDCGLDSPALLTTAPSMQTRYEQYTQEAIDKQVFGAPWYIYDGVPYWGQDRLDFLDRALSRTDTHTD